MIRKSIQFAMIIGFFTYFVFATMATGQTSIYKLNGEELEQKLMTRFTFIFYSEIDRAGAFITDDSWKIISDKLRKGAKKVADSVLTPERLELAELNVRRFALAAITFAEKTPSGELRLGESTWAKIRSTICPLWPIC